MCSIKLELGTTGRRDLPTWPLLLLPPPSLSSPSPPASGRTHSRLPSPAVASPSAVCRSTAPPMTTTAPPPTTPGPETVQDFVQLQLQLQIEDNIRSRRNKIFLLMEEVRRLRVQQRIKSSEFANGSDENEMLDIPSTIPFLPHMMINSKHFEEDVGDFVQYGGWNHHLW